MIYKSVLIISDTHIPYHVPEFDVALALAKAGKRVVLLDADFGMANSHVLLGVNPKYTL